VCERTCCNCYYADTGRAICQECHNPPYRLWQPREWKPSDSEAAPKDEGKRISILDVAKSLVHGGRGKDYGHPRDDFKRIARIWEQRIGKALTPEDVAWCMIAVKMSRLCTSPNHRDNMVDIAGYAETMDMCAEDDRP